MTEKKKLTPEEQEIQDSLDESSNTPAHSAVDDDTENQLATTQQNTAVARATKTLDIEGLEDIPMAVIPVPFVKMVHGTSTKVNLKDGKKAAPGTFYFIDSQEAVDEINFTFLKAKLVTTNFEREVEENGQKIMKVVPTAQIKILGFNIDTKQLFVLSLSWKSANIRFGQAMAQLRNAGAQKAWQYIMKIRSEVVTNKKQQEFQVPVFELVEKTSEADVQEAAQKYAEFGGALDITIDPDAVDEEQ